MTKRKLRSRKFHKKPKKWFLDLSLEKKVLVVVLLVAAVVGVGYLTPIVTKPNEKKSDLTAEQIVQRDAAVKLIVQDGEVRDMAVEALRVGDIAKADEVYQTAIDAETDPIRKVHLYLHYSEVLYASDKHADAIETAKEAESVSSDKFLVAGWLSRLYEDQRNFDKAIEYYELAAKWADSPTNKARLSEAYYKSKVDRLLVLEHVQ